MPEIRPARAEDVPVLAPLLRQADKDELWASQGREPEDALHVGFSLSLEAHTVIHGGKPIGLFGVATHPRNGSVGLCWGVSAPDLMDTHKVWFIRNTPTILEFQHRMFPKLWGVIDVRNTLHLRWLRWAGFELGAIHNVGYENRPFQEFWRYADV